MSAAKALLANIIDYAGLFPPAALDAQTALDNYNLYKNHPYAWMLGRFVMPTSLLGKAPAPDRITIVVKGESVELPPLPIQVECVEVDGSLARDPGRTVFQEIDWRGDFDRQMPERGGVKLRTGGRTPETVPPAEAVVQFLKAAANRRLQIKFTAGLHVPVPNDDPSVGARMHGFLNIFAAALAAYRSVKSDDELLFVLGKAGYADFALTPEEFRAGPLSFGVEEITTLRSNWVFSFGSCSFLEPVEHLESHGLLQYV